MFISHLIHGHANTIISRCACVITWCPERWKWHFRASRFQNFLREHAPDPPSLRGLTAHCSCSRLFFSNQLPTSNFIETPGIVCHGRDVLAVLPTGLFQKVLFRMGRTANATSKTTAELLGFCWLTKWNGAFTKFCF